jgi:hypothetical protein
MIKLINDDTVYFVAYIEKTKVVNFIAIFRSIEDNMAFDRTINKNESIFEFFVPIKMKERFLEVMNMFLNINLVISFKEEEIINSSLHE